MHSNFLCLLSSGLSLSYNMYGDTAILAGVFFYKNVNISYIWTIYSNICFSV